VAGIESSGTKIVANGFGIVLKGIAVMIGLVVMLRCCLQRLCVFSIGLLLFCVVMHGSPGACLNYGGLSDTFWKCL
jgi:hypothetical protein